jgi:hypothetical protein
MLLAYGHAEIEWQGVKYRLAPTFANIAKLGSPVEIVELFKSFTLSGAPWHKFNIALIVLNACSDKAIPESLTGRVKFSESQQRFLYVQPSHNLPMINDAVILAEHCLLHGICGKVESKGDGKPMEEFDAYAFIELAQEHLNSSLEDAANMTMTQFVRRMEAKFPPQPSNGPTQDQEAALLALCEEG